MHKGLCCAQLPIVLCLADQISIHNLSVANHSIPDPDLTPFGEEQCRQLAQSFPDHDSIDLIVCSPLRRTIYTALLGFKQDIDRCGKVIALPEAQETANVPCDTGSDLSALRKEMADKPVDLSLVMEGWNSKTDRWSPTATAIEKRAREARQWLKARPEKQIVLVTHGGFVHFFTEDWTGYKLSMGTGWANVEHRSYQFIDDESDNASVTETPLSKKRSRSHETPLTETEQIKLKQSAEASLRAGESHLVQAKV
ncbi:uncharacterized protein KY384_002687 [Bacidia gigantensis]|uniref:uncharacterized protein n=1 Tax=Bacidia gigantensis TaxID=2732470 RepID=UPI001D03DCDB|nr:uncharacterized protein KY384_002687 [Bacidia gigantensis]KAG8532809.1 hypothetical protein KY384_002687 [Bacidia gigantensis]